MYIAYECLSVKCLRSIFLLLFIYSLNVSYVPIPTDLPCGAFRWPSLNQLSWLSIIYLLLKARLKTWETQQWQFLDQDLAHVFCAAFIVPGFYYFFKDYFILFFLKKLALAHWLIVMWQPFSFRCQASTYLSVEMEQGTRFPNSHSSVRKQDRWRHFQQLRRRYFLKRSPLNALREIILFTQQTLNDAVLWGPSYSKCFKVSINLILPTTPWCKFSI